MPEIRQPGMSRREALRLLAAAGLGASLPPGRLAAGPPAEEPVRRTIPSTGEAVPAVGLGTWQTFDVPEGGDLTAVRDVLARFAALGGRLVDSSPMYGRSEAVVGRLAGDLGIRDRLFLATKVWTTGRREGIEQMRRSLALLGVERLDLMQVHNLVDVETHLATLADWKRQGRVRLVGITHYTPGALPDLERVLLRHPVDAVQLSYSVADRAAERRLLPLAAERGVAVIANRPFGSGDLFARVRGREVPEWAAAELGCASWAQVFLKFILGHPAVTCAIPATSKVHHLEDNMGAGHGPLPDEAARRRIAAELGFA